MKTNIVVIKNIGKMVSGDLKKGILSADTILIVGRKIKKIGSKSIIPKKADQVIDANGLTVIPGLIDSHTHPYLGDWTPRVNMTGWMENSVHGGITTMISQGEVHVPGEPWDKDGIKSLAILAKKLYDNFRPGGMKVHGGPIILACEMDKDDFSQLAKAGISRVAEIGGGGLFKFKDVKDMLLLARKFGMKISVHCGGISQRADSAVMTAEDVLKMKADIAVHVNGGPTSLSYEGIEKLVKEIGLVLEVVYNGNTKMMLETIKMAQQNNCLDRIIIGSDSPTGRGVIFVAILKMITMISSIGGIAPEAAIALATGNTAGAYGLNVGKIQIGKEADLLILDAPAGSVAKDALGAFEVGDMPGIAVVIIDGKIVVARSRFTAPPKRMPKVIY